MINYAMWEALMYNIGGMQVGGVSRSCYATSRAHNTSPLPAASRQGCTLEECGITMDTRLVRHCNDDVIVFCGIGT